MKQTYTKIKIETIAKNGSFRYGCYAITNVTTEGMAIPMEVKQFGKSAEDAQAKLEIFLGKDATEEPE